MFLRGEQSMRWRERRGFPILTRFIILGLYAVHTLMIRRCPAMANNSILSGGGFHHLAIRVADFEASIRFYVALGFKEKIRWGEGDQRGILLDSGDGNYMEIFAGGSSDPKPEGSFLHVAFRTNDIDAAIEVARAAGAEVTEEPKDLIICQDPRTPVRIAFFKGPDGELIELFQSTGENPL